jgi:SAM-dependent methyltransferase
MAATNIPEFDRYAHDYDEVLAPWFRITGENREYFARSRIVWLSQQLTKLNQKAARVLDFGCGTGSSIPLFLDLLGAESVLGVDVSPKSLDEARAKYGGKRAQFLLLDEYQPSQQIDLAFCNGAFHHILPAQRPAAVNCIYRSLRPGGLFALWENNPWNPVVRYIMSHNPIDRNAIPITPPQACRLLRAGHFEILLTDFLFIFPRWLGWFRRVEPVVAKLPLGSQYQVLSRKIPRDSTDPINAVPRGRKLHNGK